MSSNQALLIIDYTNDFVADKGALTCGKPGQIIEPKILELAEKMRQNGDWVWLPTDVHKPNDPYHPETKLFPTHNVQGTWGRQLYGELKPWFENHNDNEQVKLFDKTRYSAFAGTDLDLRLRERNIDTLHLVGVCTDICVLHTAIDAYNLNYKLVIHEQGVASFNQAGHEWALSHFKNSLGADVR
ncbi:cysteine hydrolase family protein [Companilactobacillus nuruki]|uniref:Isochorismatase n=1 Tax=Companilactobacillus nuruki TaxID=1993540 RepID=A0A2N7ATF8_9LACO|nr:isochorismatase family cysteine hydrolase [Companilactobacillus nuruki]PMD69468.1 isochorismatase [Companilactobacillus nuruki]